MQGSSHFIENDHISLGRNDQREYEDEIHPVEKSFFRTADDLSVRGRNDDRDDERDCADKKGIHQRREESWRSKHDSIIVEASVRHGKRVEHVFLIFKGCNNEDEKWCCKQQCYEEHGYGSDRAELGCCLHG